MDSVEPLLPALEMLDECMRRWPVASPLPLSSTPQLLPRLLRVLAVSADGEVLREAAKKLPGARPILKEAREMSNDRAKKKRAQKSFQN